MDRARKLQLATVAAISLFAATAEAARIVVLEVRGEDDSEFETMLVDAIKGEHDVVESRAFDRAARREGVGDDLDARSIAKVARSLEAAAVLDSLLARRDGEWELTIRVRGKDGLVKKKMKIELDAPRLGNKGKAKVAKQLLGVLDQVLSGDRGKRDRDREEVRSRDDRDEDVDATPARSKKGRERARDEDDEDERDARAARRDRDRGDRDEDDDDRDRRRASRDDRDEDEDDELDDDDDGDRSERRRRAARAGDDEDASLDEDLDDDLRPRRRRNNGREIRRPGLMVTAGGMAVQRKLAFTSSPDLERAPQGYPGSPAPAAHVAVELYPVAIMNPRHIAGGLGFYAEYDKVMSLTTRTSQAPDVALPTTQLRWSVGAKLRYAFGSAPNLPTITLGVGMGRRAFTVDRSALPEGTSLDLPDVDYRVYEPSLQLRFPIGTDRVALSLGARGLLFKSAGAIQTPEQYGAAKLTGIDGEVGIDTAVTTKVLLRLHGSYTTIGYDFVGNGAESNGRDGELESQDVGGASDTWLSAGASLAVLY